MTECRQCGSCCRHLPGFFNPGDEEILEKVAKYLQITIEELKNNYLVWDYRAPFGKKVWFWTPRMVDNQGKPLLPLQDCSLEEYPQKAEELGKRGGHCIFFNSNDGKCLIHPVKPFTCSLYSCGDESNSIGQIYLRYFGGEKSHPEEKIKINQGDWAACWDFYCPKCGKDEAEYTGISLKEEDADYYEVICQDCGYQFWVY